MKELVFFEALPETRLKGKADPIALFAPLKEKPLEAIEIGNTAAFLCSPLASGITGATIYVDNGLNAMGLAETAPEITG